MPKGSVYRWVKGLVPAMFIVGIGCVLSFLMYCSFVGVPRFIKTKIEVAIAEEGFPVAINTLKVSFWPEFRVVAHQVDLYRTVGELNDEGEDTPPLVEVSRLEMNFSLSQLFKGAIKLKQIDLSDTLIQTPALESKQKSVVLIDHLQGQVSFPENNIIILKGCSAVVQGIDVLIDGKFAIDTSAKDSEEPKLDVEEIAQVLSQVQRGIPYLQELKWNKTSPPVLNLHINQDIDNDGLDIRMKFDAEQLSYRQLNVSDILIEGRYADQIIAIKRLTCKDSKGKGKLDVIGKCNLETREVSWDVKSSAPVVTWMFQLFDEHFVPDYLKLHSVPQFRSGGKVVFDEKWAKPVHLMTLGSLSLGEFDVCGERFVKARADFSYNDGNLYLYDLSLRQFGSSFSGQILSKGNDIRLDLKSNLPMSTWAGFLKTFYGSSEMIPEGLAIEGKPNISMKGGLKWGGKPFESDVVVDTVNIDLEVNQVVYKELAFDKIISDIVLIGKSVNVRHCIASGSMGTLDVEASIIAENTVFRVQTDIPTQLLLDSFNYGDIIPKGLVLPDKSNLIIKGQVDTTQSGSMDPGLIRAEMTSGPFTYQGVPIDSSNLNVEYRPGEIFVKNCEFILPDGKIDLFLKGYLEGQVFMMGQSSLPLATIDRLLNDEEIDFFMKRFVFTPKSSCNVSWQGTLGLYNVDKAYDVELNMNLGDTKYNGTYVKSLTAQGQLITNQLALSSVNLTINNSEYINRYNISKAPVETTLTAEKLTFRFDHDTVELINLGGTAYPGYFMQMASAMATEILKEFVFTRPVKLSGSGLFPMGEDFSMMKGKILYDASAGDVRYKMLGTTLVLGGSRGEILASPEWIVLNKMSGTIWGGTYTGHISAQIDHGDSITGSLNLKGLNLQTIGKSYDSDLPKAQVFGAIDFSYPGGNLNNLQAKGEVAIANGNLVDMPLFGALGKGLGTFIPGFNYLTNFSIDQADCDFSIINGFIKTGNFHATGSNMSLTGNGWIRISDMETGADLKLKLKGLPGLVTSPIFLLAGGLFQVTGSGKLSDVSWSFAPFSGGKAPPPANPQPKR